MTDLRYPLGPWDQIEARTEAQWTATAAEIAAAPAALRRAVAGLGAGQLDTPYREGGWKVSQLVHHVADSHMNAYVRLKLALTEENPLIKPYDEARWAELAETPAVPVETSLVLLEALHRRWTAALGALTPEQRARTFRHPELGSMTVAAQTSLYAWHGRHHVAHVTALRARMGW